MVRTDTGIDDDGIPSSVQVSEALEMDLDGDQTADLFEGTPIGRNDLILVR